MDEERIIEEQIDEIKILAEEEVVVSIENEETNLEVQDDTININVIEDEPFIVSAEEGAIEPNLRITADHSPYLPNQHTIGAITGLREELDEIERLKTVYSDGVNQANYYMWEDENPSRENRIGYFVSIHQKDSKIRICADNEDEFGVTVSSAGFIGGQNIVPKNEAYSLVVHSGVVGVRCETDVKTGDYVVSNDYGVAKKTDGTYGYLVAGLSTIDGTPYAIISLTMPTTQMQKFSEITHDVQDRMEGAEINIATAISVANAAYNKAKNAEASVENNNTQIGEQISGVIDKIGSIEDDVGSLGGAVSNAHTIATQAKNEAQQTASQAVNANKETTAYINGLIDALDPVSEWTDEMGNNWREYLPQYIKDGVPTKAEIYDLNGQIKDNTLAINKNAMGLEIMASQIDMYSVGEYSQSYGLHLGDAWNILKVGMIYIPTGVIHTESYEYITVDVWDDGADKDTTKIYYAQDTQSYWYGVVTVDENNESTYEWVERELTYADGSPLILDKQEFTRGYYYTWNGVYWVESAHPLVYFSAEYPMANNNCIYWYRDSNESLDYDGVIYEAYGLYKWDGSAWEKVNILSGNVTNRATSALIQTATEIAANVTNSRGWLAHMGVKVEDDGTIVDNIASVVTKTNYEIANSRTYNEIDDIPNPTTGVYYAVGDLAPYDIYIWNGGEFIQEMSLFYDGVNIMKPNVASIITAANKDGDTSIALNANKINFNGYATFTKDESGNITAISGDNILSGYIISGNYDQTGDKVNSGTLINLYDGSIYTPNFKLDKFGNVDMTGKITATSGKIAEFNIEKKWWWSEGIDMFDPWVPETPCYFIFENVYYWFRLPSEEPDYSLQFVKSGSVSQLISIDGMVIPCYTASKSDIELYDMKPTYLTPGTSCISYSQSRLSYDKSNAMYGRDGVYISPSGIGLGNGKFYVDSSGNVTINGNLYMSSGALTWDVDLDEYGILKSGVTTITDTAVYSPIILGRFGVALDGEIVGYMGAAIGQTSIYGEGTIDTYGVAMSTTDQDIMPSSTFPYVVVTDRGARMSCGNNSIYVTDQGVYCVQNGGTPFLIGG